MYKYPIFISYKRENDSEEWTNLIFYPIVQKYFIGRFGKNIAFKDKDEQVKNYGNSVEDFLNGGLLYSRCMIAILNPPYLCQSYWCVREFAVMKNRAEKYEKRLLFPVIFTKGQNTSILSEACPQAAAIIENKYMALYLEEDKFYYTNKAFQDSENYNLLTQKIRNWLDGSVVPALASVPEWQADWQSEEWLNNPYNIFQQTIDCKPLYKQATLS